MQSNPESEPKKRDRDYYATNRTKSEIELDVYGYSVVPTDDVPKAMYAGLLGKVRTVNTRQRGAHVP